MALIPRKLWIPHRAKRHALVHARQVGPLRLPHLHALPTKSYFQWVASLGKYGNAIAQQIGLLIKVISTQVGNSGWDNKQEQYHQSPTLGHALIA
jgi:hypothetical protein